MAIRSLSLPRLSEPNLGKAPSIGSRVAGKYRVLALLESGGWVNACVAVEARPTSARRMVVLETLRGEQRQSTGVEAFVADARVRQQMNHPNVVQTYELVRHEGLPVIVTEYVEGESLATLLALAFGMPEFSLEMRLTILAWALRGLHYIHQVHDAAGRPLRLVHTGISPHDVIVGYDGCIKLAGFGSATAGAARGRSSAAIAPPNLEYLAPEQLHGPSLPASDVFAAGIMLWELVALQRFWSDLPEYEIRRRLHAFDIPDVARLKPNFGGQLGRICRKALAADPSQRYPTATELLIDLEQYLAERSAVAPPVAIALVMNAACGQLREEARVTLDEAFEALHGGAPRRSEAPSEAGLWRVLAREPRASSTTALWAAGTLGALLIAVAVQRTRITAPAARDAGPIASESVLLEGRRAAPHGLDPQGRSPLGIEASPSPSAPHDGDTTGESPLLAPAGRDPTTAIQTLHPDPGGEASAASPSSSGLARSELMALRRKADADARARKARRTADAARGESLEAAERPAQGESSLTIRMQR